MNNPIVIAGFVVLFVSAIMVIVDAFHEGLAWGLLCLFFPVAQLVFILVSWRDEKKRLLWMAVGLVLIFAGGSLGASSSADTVRT